jgi:hypothetical protein
VVSELGDQLAQLADADHVEYPAITRDELIALNDAPAFADTADLSWWGGLTDSTRDELRASAQRGLLARGLVTLDPDDPARLVVDDRIGFVLAVRSVPAFVTIAGNVSSADPMLRCYGILGHSAELAAVLVEARLLPGVSEFVLGTPTYAATALTRCLYAQPDATDPDAVAVHNPAKRVVVRRMEMFPPGVRSGGRRYLALAGVTAGALAAVDATGRRGPLAEVTEQGVIDLVLAGWTDDAVRAAAAAPT